MRYITPQKIVSKRFNNKKLPTWDVALICFRNFTNIDDILNPFKAKPIKEKILWGLGPSKEWSFTYETKIGNKSVLLILPICWGGPQTSIMVEELAFLKVKYIIGYGLAGSLDKNVVKGQQIVVSNALTTDGTSKFYTNKKIVKPDAKLLKMMNNIKAVKCATTDAIYRETKELIDDWKKSGVQAINMETSPFYAAAEKCNVKAIWLGYISDCLYSGWKEWFGKLEDSNRESIKNCIELISKIKI